MSVLDTGKYKDREISVLMGGWSSEREISLKTGTSVVDAIQGLGLNVKAVDVTSEDQVKGIIGSLDLVFVALHGRGGEDGFIQKILEKNAIQFTGSASEACKISMNKIKFHDQKLWV